MFFSIYLKTVQDAAEDGAKVSEWYMTTKHETRVLPNPEINSCPRSGSLSVMK